MLLPANSNKNLEKDYFLTCAEAPTDLWKHFPKCYIIVGDMDPIYDHSTELYQILKSCQRDVEFTVYPNITHAFVSMGDLCSEGLKGVYQCGNWLVNILQD